MTKKGNTTYIIIILLVIVLGLVFYLMRPSPEERDVDAVTASELDKDTVIHNVVLTQNGFEPEDLSVKKGEAVRFSANSAEFFWPASNIHPRHGIYPEFDPRDAISGSDSWTFVFDRVGEWEYHDHINPVHTGVITVIP